MRLTVPDSFFEDIGRLFKRPADFNVTEYERSMINFGEWVGQYCAGSVESRDDVVRTHGTMGNTFTVSIPSDKERDLLYHFFQAVYKKGESLCLAPSVNREGKTTYFNWFQDIDIKQTSTITDDYLGKICSVVARTVSEFFPSLAKEPYEPFIPAVSEDLPRKVRADCKWDSTTGWWEGAGSGQGRLRFLFGTSGYKTGVNSKGATEHGLGIHVYSIGRLHVTADQALTIRQAIIHKAGEEIGGRPISSGMNSWEDVFDEGVYKGLGGTRIFGSCKVQPCPDCSKKKSIQTLRQEAEEYDKYAKNMYRLDNQKIEKVVSARTSKSCKECGGRKKILVKNAYSPKFILNREGRLDMELDYLLTDPYEALLATSLRMSYRGISDSASEEAKKKFNIYVAPHVYRHHIPKYSKSIIKSNTNKKVVGETGIYIQQIMKIIVDSEWGYRYDAVVPKKFEKKRGRNKQDYWILSLREGNPNNNQMKWCESCGRHHVRDTWFQIVPYGIIQRSYSDDCRKTNTVKISLPAALTEVLFDNLEQPSLAQGFIKRGKTPEENKIASLWAENLKYSKIFNPQVYRMLVNERIANTMDKRNNMRTFSNRDDNAVNENRRPKKKQKQRVAITPHVTLL